MNLYAQYAVLILSSLLIVYVAVRKMMQGFSAGRLVVLVATVLYNVPFVWLGVWLWNRYGVISAESAFDLCVDDLWALGERLNLPTDAVSYSAGWSEYHVVNLVIFIVIYLLVLILNWGLPLPSPSPPPGLPSPLNQLHFTLLPSLTSSESSEKT